MKKIAILLFLFLLLLPIVAYAEGETETPAEVEPSAETETDTDMPTGEEVPTEEVPEEVSEATNNTIVITDANGNQYIITAGTITEGTTGEGPETTMLEETAETDAIVEALQVQGVNMDADTLMSVLTALGLDAPGLTATVQAAQVRPMLTTLFADYTVTEGLLLVLCVLLVVRTIFKLFAM